MQVKIKTKFTHDKEVDGSKFLANNNFFLIFYNDVMEHSEVFQVDKPYNKRSAFGFKKISIFLAKSNPKLFNSILNVFWIKWKTLFFKLAHFFIVIFINKFTFLASFLNDICFTPVYLFPLSL